MSNEIFEDDKVVFLDIDGVLNSALALYAGDYTGTKWQINTMILKAYKKFADKHNIKTVISSTWRERALGDIEKMEQIFLDESGISLKVYGLTPVLNAIRGYEIDAIVKSKNIKNYAIIDDTDKFLSHQMDKLVKTDILTGMTLYDLKN